LAYYDHSTSSCVSDAWALLKRGHTEREDMVMYFLQACKRFNLDSESLKHIPEGYNVGDSFIIDIQQIILCIPKMYTLKITFLSKNFILRGKRTAVGSCN